MSFNQYGNSFQRTTPVVINLIIFNALVFIAQSVFGGEAYDSKILDLFALHHYKSDVFQPYQLITYMFMHAGFIHLLFNMFGLWMIGTTLESIWGPKKFFLFYLVCGFFSGITQLFLFALSFYSVDHVSMNLSEILTYQNILKANVLVGATGAIMGLVVALGYLFPNTEMMIFPIPIPVKAKWAVLGIVALNIISAVLSKSILSVSHLGGALIGFLIVLYWNKTNKKTFY
jgi:membrane associated rhomboid family serine protease